jgi:hypothetical protein
MVSREADLRIKPYAHLDTLIGLTLWAWEPVFASIEQVLDADVYQAFYPQQWQVSQQKSLHGNGGDPGHGPAHRVYEKAGFGLWPMARYFKKL